MGESQATNLLLITFDQWRGDWIDPLKPVISLPNLKSLAKHGWTARRCYTSSPHCVPARFSWLTGLSPSQMSVTRNENVNLPADAPSIVRQLRDRGWHTSLVGKTHWTSHAHAGDLRDNLPLLEALGFNNAIEVAGPRALRRMRCNLTDAWQREGVFDQQLADLETRYGLGRSTKAWTVRPSVLPIELYPDVWIAREGIKELRTMPEKQPWFLWISFTGPHEPFDTPEPWHGQHERTSLPIPTQKPSWIEHLPESCELRKTAKSWEDLLNAQAISACRADYADHLKLLDDQVGDILNCLHQRTDNRKTAVIACADHGELLGDAQMLYKGTFLEGAIRVPWIYRPAGRDHQETHNDRVNDKPLELTSLLHKTIHGLMRGETLEPIQPWIKHQKHAVVEFGSERLFIEGKRKLAVDQQGKPLWAIHLGRDPREQCNVITGERWRWQLSPHWNRLRQIAKRETERRSAKTWVWRKLGANL